MAAERAGVRGEAAVDGTEGSRQLRSFAERLAIGIDLFMTVKMIDRNGGKTLRRLRSILVIRTTLRSVKVGDPTLTLTLNRSFCDRHARDSMPEKSNRPREPDEEQHFPKNSCGATSAIRITSSPPLGHVCNVVSVLAPFGVAQRNAGRRLDAIRILRRRKTERDGMVLLLDQNRSGCNGLGRRHPRFSSSPTRTLLTISLEALLTMATGEALLTIVPRSVSGGGSCKSGADGATGGAGGGDALTRATVGGLRDAENTGLSLVSLRALSGNRAQRIALGRLIQLLDGKVRAR